jgi:hypothetical protein
MFRGGILIAIICGALALAAVIAMPRVPPQKPLDTTGVIKGS